MTTRINARLSSPLAAFVDKTVGAGGLYETPSEYVRDLIRRDLEQQAAHGEEGAILDGYRDLSEGRSFESNGDFETDMKTLAEREAADWA